MTKLNYEMNPQLKYILKNLIKKNFDFNIFKAENPFYLFLKQTLFN